MSTQTTQHTTPALISLSLNHLGEGRPLNPQLCFTPGSGQVPHTTCHWADKSVPHSHLSTSSYCEHSVLGILYWIYMKCISLILFVTGIGSNTTNNTGILQSIYVLKPILKKLWRLLEVLINQCNKNKRLLLRCFTYREGLWQEVEQTDKEASTALQFRNRTGQKNKEQKCRKL